MNHLPRRSTTLEASSPTNGRPQDESGLTLIEVLIVTIILPLVIGAAATAIITSLRNDTAVSNRLSDSVNGQVASAYFVRDIQGASYVTTNQNLAPGVGGTFLANSPEVCGPNSVLGSASVPAGLSLLVAAYHPANGSGSALSTSYWRVTNTTPQQVVRYSCTITGTFAASNPVPVVVSDDVGNNPSDAVSSITPSQFATAAQNGWTQTVALTAYNSVTSLVLGGSVTIPVATTVDFATTAPLSVQSSQGPQTVTCTGMTATSFTGCTGGTGTVAFGGAITQGSVSGVAITFQQPASNYHYSLLGAPRISVAAAGNGLGGPPIGPTDTLLTLGPTGVTLTGTGSVTCSYTGTKSKLCINGTAVVDGGNANCNGTASIGSVSTGTVSPSGNTCPSTAGSVPFVSDPVAPLLPPCFATSHPLPLDPAKVNGNYVPGVYDSPFNSNAVLEPGVYVLSSKTGVTGGISSATITMATPSSTDPYYQNPPFSGAANYDSHAGVLFYVAGSGYQTGCFNIPAGTTDPGIDFQGNSSMTLAPLDTNQSNYWFANNPYLADMWLWQDKTNSTSLSMGGTPSITSTGLLYMPAANLVTSNGSPVITTGRMIVGGVSLSGTPTITLTGS